MTTKRGHIRLAELQESFGGLLDKASDMASGAKRGLENALEELADHEDIGADVRLAQEGNQASIEWPLEGMSDDEVCVTLSGRLFEVHAETRDHSREKGGAMVLPFAFIPDETIAFVDEGVLKVSGPIAPNA